MGNVVYDEFAAFYEEINKIPDASFLELSTIVSIILIKYCRNRSRSRALIKSTSLRYEYATTFKEVNKFSRIYEHRVNFLRCNCIIYQTFSPILWNKLNSPSPSLKSPDWTSSVTLKIIVKSNRKIIDDWSSREKFSKEYRSNRSRMGKNEMTSGQRNSARTCDYVHAFARQMRAGIVDSKRECI